MKFAEVALPTMRMASPLSGKVVFGAGADGGDLHRPVIRQRANQKRVHQGEHGAVPVDSGG
jgi:hypothetical protein